MYFFFQIRDFHFSIFILFCLAGGRKGFVNDDNGRVVCTRQLIADIPVYWTVPAFWSFWSPFLPRHADLFNFFGKMFDPLNEISDLLRSSFYFIVALLSIVIILSPTQAAIDFPVYRLQHFDLQGIKYGNLWLFCNKVIHNRVYILLNATTDLVEFFYSFFYWLCDFFQALEVQPSTLRPVPSARGSLLGSA